MRILGLVVEYNPLHLGHIYHLNQAKELAKPDLTIAVMSPHVVQRGEFACVDKFKRTMWALKAGIDLVVELPSLFVLQNADIFAKTSVDILNLLGVDTLVFGSETGDSQRLKMIAEIMRTDVYNARVKTLMQTGNSYPTSTDLALGELLDVKKTLHPNDILGVQYIQAIYELNANIKPIAIKRKEAGYYAELNKNQAIQSASAIRNAYKNGEHIATYVPTYVMEDIDKMVDLKDFETPLLYALKAHSPQSLNRLFSFDAGLENLFLQYRNTESLETLLDKLKSRRFTQAKIKRALMHMLLNIEKDDIKSFDTPYLRILGMNKAGQAYLNTIKKNPPVPIITKIKRDKHPLLEIELRISDIYDMVYQKNLVKKELQPVIIF